MYNVDKLHKYYVSAAAKHKGALAKDVKEAAKSTKGKGKGKPKGKAGPNVSKL